MKQRKLGFCKKMPEDIKAEESPILRPGFMNLGEVYCFMSVEAISSVSMNPLVPL